TESSDLPEYFRTISLWTEDYEGMDEMEPGAKFPVVDLPDYEKFDLTYNGIDEEDADYDDLRYKVETNSKRMKIRNGTLSTDTCYINISGANAGFFWPVWGEPYVKVTSSKGEFRSQAIPWYAGGTAPTQKKGSEMYWLPGGATDDTCGLVWIATDSVLLKDSDGDWWLFDPAIIAGPASFDYRWAGSNGMIEFGNVFWGYVDLYEDMGKVKDGTPAANTYTAVDQLTLWYDLFGPGTKDELLSLNTNDDEEITFQMWDDTLTTPFDLPELGYGTVAADYQAKFVSPRGTQFVSPSATSKTFKVPKSVLKATYTFATVAAATSEPDATTLVLGEGDEATIGTSGVKIKVLNITESLTPCTFGTGAGAAPTCDMSGVSAVLMPNNAPSVAAKEMFPVTSNMVVLDSAATGLETGTVITVGGDVVNTVTANAIAGSGIDFVAQPVVVRAIGNKIVVAGLNPEDTIAAGQQFVAGVTRN
ncbi:hypothetical protein H0O01_01805, partial [Candidatus Micrarchaeota archaeon]|nr:hypothetical protein [Candidatus Micrarchaeota archaeon]